MKRSVALPPKASRVLAVCQLIYVTLYLLTQIFGLIDPQAREWLSNYFFFPLAPLFLIAILCQPALRKRADILLFFALIVWYALISWRSKYGLTPDTLRSFFLTLITVFGIYPLSTVLAEQGQLRKMRAVFAVLSGMYTAICAFALVNVLILKTSVGSPYSEQFIGINRYFYNRLYVLAHPNTTAGYCMIFILLLIYLFLRAKRWYGKGCALLAIAILWITLSMADSRAVLVGTALGFGMLAFLWIQKRTGPLSGAIRWPAGIAGALAVALLSVLFSRAIFSNAVAWIKADTQPSAVSEESLPQTDDSEAKEQETFKPRDFAMEMGSLNGRLVIWKGAVNALRANPKVLLKGVGNSNVEGFVDPYRLTSYYVVHVHNSFLQTFIALGLPGFMLVLAFLSLLCWRCMRMFFGLRADDALASRYFPAIFVGCLVMAMMESMFSLGNYLHSQLFYLLAGYAMCLPMNALKTVETDQAGR